MQALTGTRLWLVVAAAMLAFAGNSVLCRLALRDGGIDAASFTSLRLVSGALVLWSIVRLRSGARTGGDLVSAFALFVYAAGFSFAYVSLSTGTGALLLFGAVQATMIGHGLFAGERLAALQWCGLALALAGLIGLLLPGVSAPPVGGALLMVAAGIAWGAYSLRGRGAGDATAKTAGNFIRAVPFALVLSLFLLRDAHADAVGILCALISGALTSGVGYAIWYTALPHLRAASAATVQLSVPAIAAIAGIMLLGEPPTWRLLFATLAILGGIGLVVRAQSRKV
ncbi:DMT family transporter [Lysobacter brunescens]|uniref:DMT family transporter n=1 Tax=Lysobacter brunescens TaxID=262323 RepID=A0ABW2YI04_9GAMM